MNLRAGLSTAHGRYELKMTSMIDVVFLLLIFFLVTLKFREPEGRLQQDLPSQDDRIVDPKLVEQVQIKVLRNGDVIRIHVNNDVFDNYKSVEERLSDLKASFERTETPYLFILDGSQDVSFQEIVNAINTCIRVGVSDVTFAPPPMSYFEPGG